MEFINNYSYVWKNDIIEFRRKGELCGRSLVNRKKKEWIITRPKLFQWFIDEILRHMFASEIRYVHQSFNPQAQHIIEAVPAQWVENHFFRSEEGNY